MQKPGPEGGCEADFVSIPELADKQIDSLGHRPEKLKVSEEVMELAKADFKGIKASLLNARKRAAVPTHSIPLELIHFLFHPNRKCLHRFIGGIGQPNTKKDIFPELNKDYNKEERLSSWKAAHDMFKERKSEEKSKEDEWGIDLQGIEAKYFHKHFRYLLCNIHQSGVVPVLFDCLRCANPQTSNC